MIRTLKSLSRARGTTALAVMAIALGVGANTALFSAVRAVLLRPLPYAHADRLVTLWERNPSKVLERQRLPPARYLEFKGQRDIFEDVAAYNFFDQNLTGIGEPDRVRVAMVAGDFFALTGAAALGGRLITPGDAAPDAPAVAVVSARLWRQRLGSGSLEGRTLRLDDRPYQVIGVVPASFDLPAGADVYIPLEIPFPESRGNRSLYTIGRLADGVDVATARARVAQVSARLESAYPGTDAGWTTTLTPLADDIVGSVGPALRILMAAVGLVLLIACADVANLLLVRAAGRRRELAVRMALGASRGRLLRQLVAESLVVSVAGGVIGLVLAAWAVPLLARLGFARFDQIHLDGLVLAFTAGITLVAGLAAGAAPALVSARGDLARALADGGRTVSSDAARRRLGSALVVAEVALAMALAAGAAVFAVSLQRVSAIDPGFRAGGVVTARVTFPRSRYPGVAAFRRFEAALLDRVAALPGVTAAGVVNYLPLGARDQPFNLRVEGRPAENAAALLSAEMRVASPGYFTAMGIPLLSGRMLDARDGPDAPDVLVVSRAMARRFWPGGDAVGARVSLRGADGPWLTIVGVVGDVAERALDGEPRPTMYLPFAQETWPNLAVVARANGDPRALAPAVVGAVRAIDPELPVYDVRRMEDYVDAALARPRFQSLLFGAFAGLALVLALAGVFGVMAYAVAERLPEMGVRLALGADPRGLLALVLGRGLRLVGAGALIGAAGAWGLLRVAAGLLVGVRADQPWLVAATAALVVAAGLAACYLPARRASRVDPVTVLRQS